MNYKNKRIELISESVKEQLGIEEDDYLDHEEEFKKILNSHGKEIQLLNEKLILKDKQLILIEKLIREDKEKINILEKKIKNFER